MIGDLDLLVLPGTEVLVVQRLGVADYLPVPGATPAWHTAADLHRTGTHASIDLHRALFDPPFAGLLPAAELSRRSDRRVVDGVPVRMLLARDHALHVMLHAQVLAAAYYCRRLDLAAAREITWLAPRLDWQEIAAWADEHGLRPVLDAMLLAAQDMFGLPWPLVRPADGSALRHHLMACRAESLGQSWEALIGIRGDGAHHTTRAATRAPRRALPRRRALCTNSKKPR
jgi:hypothetical protein